MIQRFQDDDVLKGLLVFAPFFVGVSSLLFSIKLGLFVFFLILLLAPIVYFSRQLFVLPQQRLVFIIILAATCLLIARMLLEAEANSLADKIGMFLPLLLINSFVLSVNESIFSMSDFKAVMKYVLKVGLLILLFFIVFGFSQELLSEVPVFTSPVGFFFVSGFLFAAVNFFKQKKR